MSSELENVVASELHVNHDKPPADSTWALSIDVLSAKALVWIARVGKHAELTPDAHRYFFDRYSRLAECHRRRGRLSKADRLTAKAEEHGAPGGGPPYAVAMALPRPRQFIRTDAVSRNRFDGPDDAA